MHEGLIFDLGSHKGEDTSFYLKKGFSVVAVEAHPSLANQLAQRLISHVKSGQLIVVNAAVTDKDGEVMFFADQDESIWSTLDPAWAERNHKKGTRVYETKVPATRLASLINMYGIPYYLKIDIEGADRQCIESLASLNLSTAELPRFISIESSKVAFSEVIDEFALFRQLGYTRFKIVPQHRVAKQRLPKPSLEGRYVKHRFEEGSSGAFGLELPGVWLDMDRALDVYKRIFRWYRLAGDNAMITQIAYRSLRSRQLTQTDAGTSSSTTQPSRLSSIGRTVRDLTKWLRPGWYDTHAML